MTQKVGLITYMKLKAKALVHKLVGPLSVTKTNNAYTKHSHDGYTHYKQTSRGNNSPNIRINGKKYKYNLTDKESLYVNGKKLEKGTPEYEAFQRDMNEFDVEMARLSKTLGKMNREMAQSSEDIAKNIRNLFK